MAVPVVRQADLSSVIVEKIFDRLSHIKPGGSICPSEIARILVGKELGGIAPTRGAALGSNQDWRALMEDVRTVAWQLVAEGRLEIRQKGQMVSPNVTGPIRLALPKGEGA